MRQPVHELETCNLIVRVCGAHRYANICRAAVGRRLLLGSGYSDAVQWARRERSLHRQLHCRSHRYAPDEAPLIQEASLLATHAE
jgi:hypothetical protein